jgi:magnesium transporter
MTFNYPCISYNQNGLKQISTFDPQELENNNINWIDVNNLNDSHNIEQLCSSFGIHRLITEDILNTNQMVKLDNYDDCLFIVLKMIDYDMTTTNITTEHVSIFLRGNTVISFQQNNSRDNFSRIKEKISEGRDNILKLGSEYLCYELINAVVDNYFNVIDQLGDVTDDIEEELIANPAKNTLQRIYFVKRELMYLRKSVYPLRELIGSLTNSKSSQLTEDIRIYLHDVYDHLIQIVDSIETYQDILSNMLDTYLSSISNKTNDTMKILTIISTIFIPLTFIAGIYGMNFKNIPELQFSYGYPLFWVISIIIASVMLMFFHKKKWF